MHLFRNVYTYSHLHFLLHSNVLYLESGRSTPNTTVFDPSFKTTISRQNYCDNIASRPAQWLEQEQPQAAKESRRPAVCGDRSSFDESARIFFSHKYVGDLWQKIRQQVKKISMGYVRSLCTPSTQSLARRGIIISYCGYTYPSTES